VSRLTQFAVDHPLVTIIGTLLLAGALAIPMGNITQETDFREFLEDDDPIIVLLDEAEARYGRSWGMMVMLFNENGVFNDTTLGKIESMTDQIEAIPGIKTVTTPLNSQTIVGTEAAISVRKVAPGGVAPQTPRTWRSSRSD